MLGLRCIDMLIPEDLLSVYQLFTVRDPQSVPHATSGSLVMKMCQHWAATPCTWAEKFESFERINSLRETNGNFDSCNSCKRLVPSRLHELHESKFPFVSRSEFIRSKLSNFSAHVYGVSVFYGSLDSSTWRLVPATLAWIEIGASVVECRSPVHLSADVNYRLTLI